MKTQKANEAHTGRWRWITDVSPNREKVKQSGKSFSQKDELNYSGIAHPNKK